MMPVMVIMVVAMMTVGSMGMVGTVTALAELAVYVEAMSVQGRAAAEVMLVVDGCPMVVFLASSSRIAFFADGQPVGHSTSVGVRAVCCAVAMRAARLRRLSDNALLVHFCPVFGLADA